MEQKQGTIGESIFDFERQDIRRAVETFYQEALEVPAEYLSRERTGYEILEVLAELDSGDVNRTKEEKEALRQTRNIVYWTSAIAKSMNKYGKWGLVSFEYANDILDVVNPLLEEGKFESWDKVCDAAYEVLRQRLGVKVE